MKKVLITLGPDHCLFIQNNSTRSFQCFVKEFIEDLT